ncbi:MAG TPA: chalcone isomerase family protein, partial [Woeseiaceae bacterium]|nr:chalcone isomerase family protein [Woeseiaceae bacterium]
AAGGAPGDADVPAEPLALVGEAKLQVLFWSIYRSRLYCPDGSYEPGVRPLRLEIEYLRNIRSEDLVKRTAEEWDKLGVTDPERDRWLATLGELWPDVSKNDVLAVALDRDGRTTFYHNDRRLGVLDDPAFGQRFVDIWLSPETSRPELRLALTGGREG